MLTKHLLALLVLCSPLLLLSQPGDDYDREIAEHREKAKKDFLENPRSPLKTEEALDGLRYYPPDERYRVRARFTQTSNEKPFDLPTYSGITVRYVKYGVLFFELNGQPLRLSVYKNMTPRHPAQYSDYLFLPFRDPTNGEETYGGGRYLNLRSGDIEDGHVWLDFNKCYNPWCCYSDGYSCPIPPSENHLSIPVLAGEKAYMLE